MEHVEVLWAMLRKCVNERLARKSADREAAALAAAIEALKSAPQPPAEAHCATCDCVPGMTPAIRFDTTPAEREGEVRDHLIRMGWTPPAEAQPADDPGEFGVGIQPNPKARYWQERAEFWRAQAVALGWREKRDTENGEAPPPSAPVGVEAALRDALQGLIDFIEIDNLPMDADAMFIAKRALAQQPAAVNEVKCPWDGGSPCVEPMPAGMVYPTKPAPRASGYLDSSGVEWNAWDAGQMEAYARAAYSDGWEAGYRSALSQQPAAVDDEMVERALQAWFETDDWVALLSGIEPAASSRSRMRAALTAALAAQQGGMPE